MNSKRHGVGNFASAVRAPPLFAKPCGAVAFAMLVFAFPATPEQITAHILRYFKDHPTSVAAALATVMLRPTQQVASRVRPIRVRVPNFSELSAEAFAARIAVAITEAVNDQPLGNSFERVTVDFRSRVDDSD